MASSSIYNMPPYDAITRNDGVMFDHDGDDDVYDDDVEVCYDNDNESESANSPSYYAFSPVADLAYPLSQRAKKKKLLVTASLDLDEANDKIESFPRRKMRKIDVAMALDDDNDDADQKEKQAEETGVFSMIKANHRRAIMVGIAATDGSETSLYIEEDDDDIAQSAASQNKIVYQSQIKRIAISEKQGSVRMLLEL